MKDVKVEDLQVGDLIYVCWMDAFAFDRQRLPKRDKTFKAPVHRVGWFLGLKGTDPVHLVIAHEKLPEARVFSFDCIPVSLIKHVVVVYPRFMQKYMTDVFKELKKYVKMVSENPLPRRWEVTLN